MARRRGTFTLSSNIELEAGAPLDSRDIVQNKADLTNGSFSYSYVGMETYVRSEDKKYRLIGDDPTVLSNWVEVGSGSGSEAELVEISEEDYAALTTEEKNDPTKVYFRYEANGFFKSIQDNPEATAFEGEKLATGRTIESVVDGKLEGKLDLTGGTMTGDLLTDTQTDIHAQRNLYLGNNGTSEESAGRSQLHFRRKGGRTNGITTLAPLQSKGIDDSYDENHYTQNLQCKSGTIALLEDVNKKADSTTVEGSTSVSGNPIAISDAANAYAEEVIANIEPIQDLHGYDHPWVGGAGKNLLPLMENTITDHGITITPNKDNAGNVVSLTLNGTATNDVYIFIANDISIPNERFTLSWQTINSYLYMGLDGLSDVGGGSSVGYRVYDGDGVKRGVFVRLYGNRSYNGIVIYPMLELGSSAATFAPYSNICPISGLDSVEVKRIGKNLFNPSAIISGKIIDGEVVTISSTNDWISGYKTPVNVTSLYMKILDNKDTYTGSFYAACWDEKGDYLGFSNVISFNDISIPYVGMLTLQTGTKYFMLLGYNANGGVTKIKSVVAIISVADVPYEPYTAETHTTSLPQTTYGGTLNIQTGELVVDRVLKSFNGSETWNIDSRWANCYYTAWVNDSKYTPSSIGFGNYTKCNMYYGVAKQISNLNNGELLFNSVAISTLYANIVIKEEKYASIDDFKASLSSAPLQIVYELATPQTYQLTPSQVKLLLEHNNISTNADTLELTYQVNNVLGEILSESEEYTDRVVEARCRYSTQETIIGEWIDGKPIYRKVYDNLNGQYGSTAFQIDASDLNIDRLIFLDALGSDGAGYTSNKYLITSVTSVNSRNMYLNANNRIVIEGSYLKCYIIVEYTKTTD